MRTVPLVISTVITAGLVYALNKPWGETLPMPAGKFLSPQHGFWQNAEPADQSFDADLNFPALKGKTDVLFDERLVPHVFAENDEDLYFIQGYLHAKFRLFQMDLQTKAAAGRASEIAGSKAINFDKGQRRLGMVYAAENAMKEIEKDPKSKVLFDAYTNGVNTYIKSLTAGNIPLEYKLLNIEPEEWTNLRTALLLKMMAKMLSGETEHDLANTNSKNIFSSAEYKMIYPDVPDSLAPIIPKGTVFDKPGIVPVKPVSADSLYFSKKDTMPARPEVEQDKTNGSNNWVVAGSKTQSGAPILCNDPHLELSLPSIWYEMQLVTPNSNTYGVSLPGSPFIIIGFNDSISWGVTNAQRDVKDYYEIKFKDHTKKEYWFDGKWTKTILHEERIKVKGGKDVLDTVAYTIFGPVLFDENFSNDYSQKKNLAVRWTAHDPSNEGISFYKLNRAHNYDDYAEAIKSFNCPGQNFIFASHSGDIAIWQQGTFPARWDMQGIYVMPGQDSSYMWQGNIPQAENPHIKNPVQGFLQSANQRPVDSTYPYFIPGSYITARGITLYNKLSAMKGITPADMMKLHSDYFNTLAEDMRPVLLGYVKENDLKADEKKYVEILRNWDLMASPGSKGQSVYQCWLDSLEKEVWQDEVTQINPAAYWPEEQTLMELLKKDSAIKFIDNINTAQKETLFDIVTAALKKASGFLKQKESEGGIEWYKINKPGIYHVSDASKSKLLPFARTNLHVGGYGNIINAVKGSHGPSWRMIVHLTSPVEAYGVYPGGQSGNPGSKFYDNYIDNWVNGKYFQLWYMRNGDKNDAKVKWRMKFLKSS
jgi:penicillin amidase